MPKRIVRAGARSFRTPAARYPADPRAIFILAACVLSGVAFLAGSPRPNSVEAKLDHGWVIVWALMIGVGGLVTLSGTFRLNPNGISLEQLGSVILFGGTLVYAAAVWSTIGASGMYPALFQLSFGVASLWRAGQLQGLVRDAQRQAGDR